MGEMADYLLEQADADVNGVLEAPRKTGGSKQHIHQHTQPKICAHHVQFEDCVFFPGDVSCGEEACAAKPRRLRAGA